MFRFNTVYLWQPPGTPKDLGVIVAGVIEVTKLPKPLPEGVSEGSHRFDFRMEHAMRPGWSIYGSLAEQTPTRLVLRDERLTDSTGAEQLHVFELLTLDRLKALVANDPVLQGVVIPFTSDAHVQTYYSEELVADDWVSTATARLGRVPA